MSDLLATLAFGAVATLVMPIGLYALPPLGLLSPVEQARAFGSFMTGKEDNALARGVAFGVVMGIVWAFVYVALWSVFANKTLGLYVVLGIVSGAFFGENLSMTAALVFADNHPIPRFRENAWRIALGTVLIHLVHGAVFGFFAGTLALDYSFIPKVINLP